MQEQYIHIDKYGDKFYYKDREMTIFHRLNGPAVEHANGYKSWCVDGKRHRLDGPAVEYADGSKAWWVDGRPLTEKQFLALTSPTLELTLYDTIRSFITKKNLVIITKEEYDHLLQVLIKHTR